ncbi:hypothetical protein PV689_05855 [Streptomyces sp. ATCC51928]|uniref:Integral membrane protein n=1 Tax=Streptomyces caviscabies TaxID=90079 RepID=A0ABW2M899_9ACTN|nr:MULTISPECIES: hypothetical protein [unclassified Streptomyces]MDX3501434.1 hypothetical protein [Streptomyces sp. ATCC51928]MDX5521448.1 hypothetical protein [Streptomyces sp. DE06-01C]
MAEHDAERTGSDEEREPRATEPAAVPEGTKPAGDGGSEQERAIDEDAAWAAIVAGYGEEPPDPPGAKPFKSIEDLALLEDDQRNVTGPDDGSAGDPADKGSGKTPPKPPEKKPLGSSVVFAPGVAGPRDYELPASKDDGIDVPDDGDEGHFVPPEPPPLPEADVTAKFAWLAVIGGPVLMLIAVLLRWEMTWWLTTLCIGGFLGGFATLVARMPHDDDDDTYGDPGRGAVV